MSTFSLRSSPTHYSLLVIVAAQFCTREGIGAEELFTRCKESQAKDVKARHYIDVMLSSVSYEKFVNLMIIMKDLHGARLDRQDLNAEGEVRACESKRTSK